MKLRCQIRVLFLRLDFVPRNQFYLLFNESLTNKQLPRPLDFYLFSSHKHTLIPIFCTGGNSFHLYFANFRCFWILEVKKTHLYRFRNHIYSNDFWVFLARLLYDRNLVRYPVLVATHVDGFGTRLRLRATHRNDKLFDFSTKNNTKFHTTCALAPPFWVYKFFLLNKKSLVEGFYFFRVAVSLFWPLWNTLSKYWTSKGLETSRNLVFRVLSQSSSLNFTSSPWAILRNNAPTRFVQIRVFLE